MANKQIYIEPQYPDDREIHSMLRGALILVLRYVYCRVYVYLQFLLFVVICLIIAVFDQQISSLSFQQLSGC
ncbi:hypothetical protein XENTR_v10017567 [Xenopus tropicalis]|nr:hypothetical protein XENTR_v10017567 [Xenopus tropicalis]